MSGMVRKVVEGQRVVVVGHDRPGTVCRIWPDDCATFVADAGLLVETSAHRLTPIEPRWRGTVRHIVWRARFGAHMLAQAFRWWHKPWQPPSDDPYDCLSLRTALAVAWIILR